MSQILEIPDSVYDALREAADAGGTSPVEWIAARLAEVRTHAAEPPDTPRPTTLADLFAGRVGRIHSGGAGRLSERGGDDLAESLEIKRGDGCL